MLSTLLPPGIKIKFKHSSPDEGPDYFCGYTNSDGVVCIDPALRDNWDFEYGTAVVYPENRKLYGLIDKEGKWVVFPNWLYLNRWFENVIIVENTKHQWGAINLKGETLVEFLSFDEWQNSSVFQDVDAYDILKDSVEVKTEADVQQCMVDTIVSVWKIKYRKQIGSVFEECKGDLSGMEGVLDSSTSQRDLREAGIWGREVKLLRDKTNGMLQPGKGETGRIGCYYPVGLDIFDLAIEAPVNSLQTCPDASVGVQWRDLILVEGHGAGEIDIEPVGKSTVPNVTSRVVGVVSVLRDLAVYALGFLMIWLYVGLVGICLNVIVSGIHKYSSIGPVAGALCGVYLVMLLVKIVMNVICKRGDKASAALALAYQDGLSFFVWNIAGFVIWFLIVLSFKGVANVWFALGWEAVAVGRLLWMLKRLYSTNS